MRAISRIIQRETKNAAPHLSMEHGVPFGKPSAIRLFQCVSPCAPT